jgi:hypothetical protein
MDLSGPEIEIDGIVFRLVARDSFETYKVVGFMSAPRGTPITSPKKQSYVAYKSNSEGFWRLALRGGPGYSFEKGKNYVTTTFIHLRLQAFIEEHYESLRAPPKQGMFMASYNSGRGKELMNAVLSMNKKNNPDEDRLFFDPVFELIQASCVPSIGQNCVARTSAFVRYMNPPRALPPLPRVNNSGPKTPSPPVSGPQLSWAFPTISPEVAAQRNAAYARRNALKRDEQAQYKRLYVDAGSPEYIQVPEMLRIMSRFVEQNFEVNLGIQEHLFDMPFYMEAGEKGAGKTEERFIIHIYHTMIRNRSTGQEYNLYYSQFTRKGKHYKNILNIVPVEATILENGLYSKYVSATPYIYKMFDYSDQCIGFGEGETECERYVFIAGSFVNMWPLPLLRSMNGAGKRRRTIKRRKSLKSRKN